jgi:hypothetical protein
MKPVFIGIVLWSRECKVRTNVKLAALTKLFNAGTESKKNNLIEMNGFCSHNFV